ncbi:transcription factor Hsr1 [Phytophthora pseudosyringae]|uniref:Transcription factor Hsr1 n=1 Tax=Phytophthora pseudosyringae TaxID=221518 RepID=A0A8T1VCN6_9STRA|nr:transcription factor Hsr1 [Phytophthora pseudosyringae]
MQAPALPAIATAFVRKLYRILDQESAAVIAWDADGASFVLLDCEALEAHVLPRYFRGRLSAFRQQLKEHSFTAVAAERGQERYRHPFFRRGCPEQLNQISHTPLPRKRPPRKKKRKQPPESAAVVASDVKIGKSGASSRWVHQVVQQEPEPELRHAVVDPAVLAGNPLFAQDDSLDGFVQGLAGEGLPVPLTDSIVLPTKDEAMSQDVMEALLALLSTSLSTDGRGAATVASTTSANSTSSTNIFAEGRPPVVLPPLPPGIVENGQFSDDTLNNLLRWVSANGTQ